MKERTACYIRVSTAEQKLHGLSLDAQRDTLKRYAEAHKLEIVQWYEDEGISGRKEVRKRPALQRMMNDAEKELFQRIIFIKLDRYFRSVGEYYACQKILDAHGILWSATQEDYDLTTATGRLLVSQKLAIAEYEADNTGERIRLVNEYKVRNGQPLYGTHSMKIGFMVKNTENGKRVVHDPEKEELAKDIISTFLQVQSIQGTLREINIRHGTNIYAPTIKHFLRSPMLYGSYRGNDSYCEPYITKDTFDKIQCLLPNNIKITPSNNIYLFSGLLKCPICNKRLSACYSENRFYYRCRGRINRFHTTGFPAINEKYVEAQLLEILEAEIKKHIASCELSERTKVRSPEPILQEIKRLNKMFQKGRIEESDYDREYDRLSADLKQIEDANNAKNHSDMSKYLKLLAKDWKFQYGQLDREHKRSFWRGIIKEITVNNDKTLHEIIFF